MRMMEENRSGGENTSALLDTLQQAMIRLLDRVDEIELAQRNAVARIELALAELETGG